MNKLPQQFIDDLNQMEAPFPVRLKDKSIEAKIVFMCVFPILLIFAGVIFMLRLIPRIIIDFKFVLGTVIEKLE